MKSFFTFQPKNITIVFIAFFLSANITNAQNKTFDVKPFSKVVISPHIEDAKTYTEKDAEKSTKQKKVEAYKSTVAKATVYYKKVKTFSLRGEENFNFEDAMISDKVAFNIYGESQVTIKDITVKELKVAIYGESHFKIETGSVENQKITGYGESIVDLLQVNNKETKITAYGDGSYQFNVSDILKITSFGEPTITYKGSADLESGISIGEVEIVKLD